MSLIICSKSSAHRALTSPIGGPLTKYKAVLVRVHLHSSLQRNPSFGTTERVFSRKHESRCFVIIPPKCPSLLFRLVNTQIKKKRLMWPHNKNSSIWKWKLELFVHSIGTFYWSVSVFLDFIVCFWYFHNTVTTIYIFIKL